VIGDNIGLDYIFLLYDHYNILIIIFEVKFLLVPAKVFLFKFVN
jgi:hypothetical protein